MKQKYTITVAGIELNVLSDGTAESVETVVANLDRKMREIFLHSPRCSKNEAAMLCALDFCANHIAEEAHLAELEEEVTKNQAKIANLESENSRLTASLDRLLKEKRALEKGEALPDAATDSEPTRKDVASVEAAASAKAKNGKKSRVGNMFDLLTFNDDI